MSSVNIIWGIRSSGSAIPPLSGTAAFYIINQSSGNISFSPPGLNTVPASADAATCGWVNSASENLVTNLGMNLDFVGLPTVGESDYLSVYYGVKQGVSPSDSFTLNIRVYDDQPQACEIGSLTQFSGSDPLPSSLAFGVQETNILTITFNNSGLYNYAFFIQYELVTPGRYLTRFNQSLPEPYEDDYIIAPQAMAYNTSPMPNCLHASTKIIIREASGHEAIVSLDSVRGTVAVKSVDGDGIEQFVQCNVIKFDSYRHAKTYKVLIDTEEEPIIASEWHTLFIPQSAELPSLCKKCMEVQEDQPCDRCNFLSIKNYKAFVVEDLVTNKIDYSIKEPLYHVLPLQHEYANKCAFKLAEYSALSEFLRTDIETLRAQGHRCEPL